ncbi:MAG: DUF1499 domain-containing protein [Thermodesulfobacteriota bacterium]
MNKPILLTVCTMMLAGCAGSPPKHIGLRDGRLAPCPGKPNCVISDANDAEHYIDPIRYTGDRKAAMQRLKAVAISFDRSRIVSADERYLHMEFKSLVFRFVDDVEFYFPDEPLIHVRSASRIGYSDLGVNRKRVEAIRAKFNEGK